jgi:hypothetical protein
MVDEALADARRLGSLPHVLALSCYRALHHLRTGNLADAEADARVALETGPRPPGLHAAAALAALLETLAERAEFQAAEAADERAASPSSPPTACPTATSPRTCSSPPGPSKGTSPTPTRSSPSPPASNSPPPSHPPRGGYRQRRQDMTIYRITRARRRCHPRHGPALDP